MTSTSGPLWVLNEPLEYDGRWQHFTVPAGFGTDFATIPQVLRWFIDRTGAHTRAAILHDWLVTDGIETGVVTHRDADGIFRRVLRETGTPFVRRWIMWCGVRYGSLWGGRRDGWWRDLPLVAATTVLAAPVVVPPTVLAAAAYTAYWLAEAIVGIPARRR
ncbi:DUF1353 domain-containing protein [Pseudonocardia sp. NPDC049635]|uniref:DUF1353 domain-containing protein n=1 Tax=Pseudonocardia sp. NPDC049635 TaxID=3155506 RepID=UPI0033F14F8D